MEINFSNEPFLEGVLQRVEAREELIIRESGKAGNFNLEKFVKTCEELVTCNVLRLHINSLTSLGLYYFKHIPIFQKTIFTRSLEGAFSSTQIQELT